MVKFNVLVLKTSSEICKFTDCSCRNVSNKTGHGRANGNRGIIVGVPIAFPPAKLMSITKVSTCTFDGVDTKIYNLK